MDTVPKSAKRPQPKGGSRKGIPNKTTQSAKEAISIAADKLGGSDRLVAWAKEDPANERAFWATIYPKLLPLQVNGSADDGSFITKMVVEFVKSNDS